MSKKHATIAARHNTSHGSLKSYTFGFILSIILTLIPFYLVVNEVINGWALVFSLFGFAIAQLLVQLQFFIHLGEQSKPRWNLIMFLCMALILMIVVFGSLWIMNNLNYHMMPGHEAEKQLIEEEGIQHH
jgi:cytochrome o ubiquinol oxidase operon protein cyoD